MNTRMFRQAALDRLSSPEQLDQRLQIVTPRRWLALVGVFLLLAAAVGWAFLGFVTTSARGQGVIIRTGGVLNVVTYGGGMVTHMDVKTGDHIRANQVIAKVAQPILVEKIRAAESSLREANEQHDSLQHVRKSGIVLSLAALERQRENTEVQISQLKTDAELAKQQIGVEEQLLEKGLVTKQQVIDARKRLTTITDKIADLNAQLKQYDAQKYAAEHQPDQEEEQMKTRISSLRWDLNNLQKQESMAENVTSPYSGQVVELKVYVGGNVKEGEPILSIQPDTEDLELLAYLPAMEAKKTRVGMAVQVSPSTVKREEFGFIKGRVVYISEYPATKAAIMRNFENESLVTALGESGPVMEVRVALEHNPQTPSGFDWSTSHTPNVLISSGTFCSVDVITLRQKPIALVFPYLKSELGMS